MATKLQCEICGGKLIGKAGGIYECDSCGMEYDTTWVKEKIQQIQGTVKVEGTVEVTGKVQVDSDPNVRNLLKRGFQILEQRDLNGENFTAANEYFDRVLDIDAECGEAYLGKIMADRRVKKREDLKEQPYPIDANNNHFYKYSNDLIRCATPELKRFLDKTNKQIEKNREERVARRRREEQEKSNAAADSKAENLCRKGDEQSLLKAENLFSSIRKYKDAAQRAEDCRKQAKVQKEKQQLLQSKDVYRIARDLIVYTDGAVYGLKANGTVVKAGCAGYGQCDVSGWTGIVALAAKGDHTVGLRADGTVVSAVSSQNGQCDVSGWKGIVAIATGSFHTVGLRADGRVEAIGDNENGQCDVDDWTDIAAIAVSDLHTVGLRADGTVTATTIRGDRKTREVFEHGQSDVSGWKGIVAIAAGGSHTVGLKKDGTVVAVGANYDGQCNVSGWKDVTVIAAGENNTYGLTRDGTLLTTGEYASTKAWKQIVSFSSMDEMYNHAIIALRTGGTVIADNQTGGMLVNRIGDTSTVSDWSGVISVAAGLKNIYGVKADGTIVATEYREADKSLGQDKVSDWKLFNSIEELEERYERIRKARLTLIEKNIAARQKRMTEAETELANLKGMFTGKRRRELEEQIDDDAHTIAFMQEQLKKLQ